MDPLQQQFEKAIGDQFFEWLNTRSKTTYSFSRRAGEAPDLVYVSGEDELLVEITSGYYDGKHAEFLWKGARGTRDAPANWNGVDPDKSLAQAIAHRVAEKCAKRYGERSVLLINVPPGVTSAEELSELLAKQSLPVEAPFAAIYVVGRFPMTSSSSGGYRVIPIKELPANHTPNPDARKSGARRLA
jgi:hypothetical protein